MNSIQGNHKGEVKMDIMDMKTIANHIDSISELLQYKLGDKYVVKPQYDGLVGQVRIFVHNLSKKTYVSMWLEWEFCNVDYYERAVDEMYECVKTHE